MKYLKFLPFFFLVGGSFVVNAQSATITGVILDETQKVLGGVNVSVNDTGTISGKDGFYLLKITSDKVSDITFSHLGYKNVVLKGLILKSNEIYEFNPILKSDAIQMDGITVSPSGKKSVDGITTIAPEVIRNIPGANAGVENILKLLPGVSSNNELSTQYSVRGGNYDENLVYINEIEVYRPFLIRSAQQEGMSFINTSMVQNVRFSPGGFQAKYGDKLSSVLDINYMTPSGFGIELDFGLLGASATIENVSKDSKFSNVSGIRYRNNSLFVNSLQTNTNFNPVFVDLQTFTTYRFSKKFRLNFLGNISLNDYENKPRDRKTNFGTLNDPKSVLVFYEGNERNRYHTVLGALKGTYSASEAVILKLIASAYHTTEEERSDIIAEYELGPVGERGASQGIGSQFNRARNELDALIFNITHKGAYSRKNSSLEWGIKYTHEDIRDQLRESEFIDSTGFFIRPPVPEFSNNQPQQPFTAPLEAFTGVNARNFVKTNRFSGFVQFGNQLQWNGHDLYFNLGIRAQYWDVDGDDLDSASHFIFSPRGQFAIKPNWKKDMLFRLSAGLYQQPPFYRELRDYTGTVRPEVKAQKSIHYVIENEYSFTLWESPFTLLSSAYYKKLDDVNIFTLEDVRIRYIANNEARAFVYGTDFRLNGAFVPGTESWLSIGFMQTKENSNSRGYIPRPTDQRLKLGILFQDYVPEYPNFKMYLNLVYNTGLPGGSPNYSDPYVFQNRLRDYKRADLGISHIFVDGSNRYPKNHWLHSFQELSAGLEIFNLFNNQNSITNTWVRDVDSKQQFAVPNFMTGRVLNVRVSMRF